MTTTPMSPAGPADSTDPAGGPAAGGGEGPDFQTVSADLLAAGRLTLAGHHLAGLLAAGASASAPTSRALLKDVWPGVDPAVEQEIFDRGVQTGWSAQQVYASPRFAAEDLEVQRARLAAAGFEAMAGMVGRARGLVVRAGEAHPADGEVEREHGY